MRNSILGVSEKEMSDVVYENNLPNLKLLFFSCKAFSFSVISSIEVIGNTKQWEEGGSMLCGLIYVPI